MAGRVKKAATAVSKLSSRIISKFELEKTFITFLVVYFPVTWLFLYQGVLEKTILTLFTGLMILAAAAMMYKFLRYVAKAADQHSGEYGSVFTLYLLDMLLPLVSLKFFAHVIFMMLPRTYWGVPELVRHLFKLISWSYGGLVNVQDVLTAVIVFSFVIFTLVAVWSIGRKDLKK